MKKKICFITVIVLFVCMLVGCTSSKLNKINLEELNNKVKNQETFILYCSSENRNNLEEKLSEILDEYNLQAYFFNPSKLTQDEINTLKLTIDYDDPSIVFIINGIDPTILSHANTNNTKEEIIQRLKDMNFITE